MLINLFTMRLGLVVAAVLSAAAASLIPNDKIARVLKVASFCFVVGFAVIEIVYPNDALFIAKIGILLMVRQILLIWLAGFASFMFDTDVERWLDRTWLIEVIAAILLTILGVLGAFLTMPVSKLLTDLLEVIK